MAAVDGLKAVLSNMNSVTNEVVARVADAVEISAIKVANHAKANHTPGQAHALGRYQNVTTNLTNSIIPTLTKADKTSVEAVVSTSKDYGPYVEFGTHGKTGYPFMRPAKESQAVEFPKRVKAAIHGNA